ncbi:MAG: zinc-finger domain-containing protein [Stellaceae bacterium]
MQPFETVYVDDVKVACAGEGVGGHPLVYLNLSTEGRIECPYCSRLFILKDRKDGASAHGQQPPEPRP